MKNYLFLNLLALPFLLSAQTATLEVEVLDVSSSEGDVLVAVYTEEETFLEFEHVYRAEGAPASKGKTRVVITDLPLGEYALAIFHDENANEKLDTNFLGIPKEPLGFSNAKLKAFGPPGFKECVVNLQKNMVIQITLE
jgi:uncharacterized protein (DUF2141 family)